MRSSALRARRCALDWRVARACDCLREVSGEPAYARFSQRHCDQPRPSSRAELTARPTNVWIAALSAAAPGCAPYPWPLSRAYPASGIAARRLLSALPRIPGSLHRASLSTGARGVVGASRYGALQPWRQARGRRARVAGPGMAPARRERRKPRPALGLVSPTLGLRSFSRLFIPPFDGPACVRARSARARVRGCSRGGPRR